MQLGLSSYTYGWAAGVPGHEPAQPLDAHGLLDRARRHGLHLVQICDNMPFLRRDAEWLDKFASRARREGIQIEIGSRGLTSEHVAECAAVARRVGARLIRMVIDGPDHHPTPVDAGHVLRDVVSLLDGLTLGIENHDRFPAKTLRALIEAAGSDRIGICLDTANSLGAGEGLESVVATLAPVTVNLHVKDFQISRLPHSMGFTVEGRPAGAGMLDVPWLLQQLAPHRRCVTAVLELWTPPEAAFERTLAKEEEWADRSLAHLRSLFRDGASG